MVDEKQIPPPVNPLTKALNLQFTRWAAAWFMAQYLPTYVQVVTSDLRSVEHNKEVDGAPNSAHVHGLAEDFQLKFKAGGVPLSQSQARAVYDQIIAPNWPGFTEFEASSAGEGYHIHWNLSREITTYAGMLTMAGMGIVGIAFMNQLAQKRG